MPLTYAHYRFGAAMLSAMPGDARRTIQRFRGLFDVGLHGPDIFYYRPSLIKTKTSGLGIKFHEQTGQTFFPRACRAVRLERSEAAQAYLYGVLCHYCLDSVCHRFVRENSQGVNPWEIETEFDRFLLEQDGKTPPCSQDLSRHLHLTPGECKTVAKLYPPAAETDVKESLRSMVMFTRMLSVQEGTRRTVLEKSLGLLSSGLRGLVMTNTPNPRCAHLNEGLYDCYQKAAEQFPEMLSQLQAHLTYSAPFGEEFADIFG